MTALYQLTGDMLALSAALDACETDAETGEVAAPPDLLALLDSLGGEYANKLDACARVVRSFETEAAGIEAEAERLRRRSEALHAQAQRLMDAMRRSLVATHTNAVKGPLFTVSLRQAPERVDVLALDVVPADLRRAPAPLPPPEEWPVDKAAAAKRLKAGEEIPGLALTRGESTLSIR